MTPHDHTHFRHSARRPAFTLTELLVVIGIIVLVLAFAVPMFNIMSGDRSVEGGQNVLSAMLQRARSRAIAVQEKRGVLFFEEPATGNHTVALVKLVSGVPPVVEIDTDADDIQTMPKGVGISGISLSSPLRYQPFGLIMFDGLGRTEIINYAIRKTVRIDAKDVELEITRRFNLTSTGNVPVVSVSAMGLYDKAQYPKETNDDPLQLTTNQIDWLDKNMMIVVMNRYNGTLIRAE
jgi:prepilin-type N-terminal cleavage/methylation domain-containing protein